MSLISRRGVSRTRAGPRGTTESEHGDPLDLLEEDLIQLTIPIPYTWDEDIPMHMRRHTDSGRGHFTRVLRKVAWVVVCYSEHHHDD